MAPLDTVLNLVTLLTNMLVKYDPYPFFPKAPLKGAHVYALDDMISMGMDAVKELL